MSLPLISSLLTFSVNGNADCNLNGASAITAMEIPPEIKRNQYLYAGETMGHLFSMMGESSDQVDRVAESLQRLEMYMAALVLAVYVCGLGFLVYCGFQMLQNRRNLLKYQSKKFTSVSRSMSDVSLNQCTKPSTQYSQNPKSCYDEVDGTDTNLMLSQHELNDTKSDHRNQSDDRQRIDQCSSGPSNKASMPEPSMERKWTHPGSGTTMTRKLTMSNATTRRSRPLVCNYSGLLRDFTVSMNTEAAHRASHVRATRTSSTSSNSQKARTALRTTNSDNVVPRTPGSQSFRRPHYHGTQHHPLTHARSTAGPTELGVTSRMSRITSVSPLPSTNEAAGLQPTIMEGHTRRNTNGSIELVGDTFERVGEVKSFMDDNQHEHHLEHREITESDIDENVIQIAEQGVDT